MIYKFRILSDEVDEFVRVFEVPDNTTFFNFHLALQNELEYDNSQIACFYLSNENWEKLQGFSLFDLAEGSHDGILSMEKSILKDYIDEKKERLIYIFDIFSERVLFMELVDILNENGTGPNIPVCTYSAGNPPRQIFMDNMNLNTMDIDMDIDLDAEGNDFDFEDIDHNLDMDFEDLSFNDE